jgi:hypothetical protein
MKEFQASILSKRTFRPLELEKFEFSVFVDHFCSLRLRIRILSRNESPNACYQLIYLVTRRGVAVLYWRLKQNKLHFEKNLIVEKMPNISSFIFMKEFQASILSMRSFSPSDREKFEFPVFVDYFCSF